MVVVAGDAERLIVSQGPSSGYRITTAFSSLLLLAMGLYVFGQLSRGAALAGLDATLLSLALLNLLALLRWWSTTEFRFER